MVSSAVRKPSLGASPLRQLADYFAKARKREGLIQYATIRIPKAFNNADVGRVPENFRQMIKDYREHGSEHSEKEVEAMLRVLQQPEDSNLCVRVDAVGLFALCSIFVHSQSCLAQQRGLALLAVSYCTLVKVLSLNTFRKRYISMSRTLMMLSRKSLARRLPLAQRFRYL